MANQLPHIVGATYETNINEEASGDSQDDGVKTVQIKQIPPTMNSKGVWRDSLNNSAGKYSERKLKKMNDYRVREQVSTPLLHTSTQSAHVSPSSSTERPCASPHQPRRPTPLPPLYSCRPWWEYHTSVP